MGRKTLGVLFKRNSLDGAIDFNRPLVACPMESLIPFYDTKK
jgi:hypothetical protein